MTKDNPYQSPAAAQEDGESAKEGVDRSENEEQPWEEWITTDTIVPRFIASVIDNAACFIVAIVVGKLCSFTNPIVQGAIFYGLIIAYFPVLEGLFARTPGKFLMGLIIVDLEGEPAGWKAAGIRFLWRLLEVNPLLLGALPAAISVIVSKWNQRLGDRYAGTLVVPKRRI